METALEAVLEVKMISKCKVCRKRFRRVKKVDYCFSHYMAKYGSSAKKRKGKGYNPVGEAISFFKKSRRSIS